MVLIGHRRPEGASMDADLDPLPTTVFVMPGRCRADQSWGVPTQRQVANWQVKKTSIRMETARIGRIARRSTAHAPSHMNSGKRMLA